MFTGKRRDRDYSGWTAAVVTLPSYTLVDAHLSVAAGRNLELFGRWDNIGNTRYETVFGYGTPGSAVSAGFRARF